MRTHVHAVTGASGYSGRHITDLLLSRKSSPLPVVT